MKKQIKVGEIVGYVISGLIGAFGLALMITGMIGRFLPGPSSENIIRNAERSVQDWSHIGFGFTAWGAIFLLAGAIITMFILLKYAKAKDIDYEKAQRRAQRLEL